jgi:glycosyl hydrolase family 114
VRDALSLQRRTVVVVLAASLVMFGAACSLFSSPTPAPTPPPQRPSGIWKPKPGTTWQWQITGRVDTTVAPADMYDIDMQDAMPSARSVSVPGFGSVNWPKGDNAGVIDTLHRLGKVVICYMDSGAWESYRPDASLFPAAVIGNNTGWDGERWLDIRLASRASFAPLIWSRMDVARSIGCDGIEPDQNNPIGNDPGFPITVADQTSWYLEVATQAHARGLSVGMKNGIESINTATVSAFDWALNEECFQYDECDTLAPFVRAGKAVFQVEYQGNASTFCPVAIQDRFSTMKKRLDLASWRQTCF